MNETTPVEIVEAELVGMQPNVEETNSNGNAEFSWFQTLLSKRALDTMMFCGGGLLTVGFAVWLWSIGVFANPIVLASAVGAINLALLGSGMWLRIATDFKITGRGILFLSSLLLPLNLWLYDSQGLISVADSEPLWIPALIISALYALIARVTRDSMFVYTLVGGIVLTGLLFIAAGPATIAFSTLPIATFLIVAGITCVLADAWFLEGDGDFSRQKFGLAFFRCGIVVLASALGVLFTGQFASIVNSLLLGHYAFTELATNLDNRLWSLGNLLAIAATCVCINNTRRKDISASVIGALSFIWAIAILFLLLNIELTLGLGVTLAAAVLVVGNVAREFFATEKQAEQHYAWSAILGTALLVFSSLQLVAGGLEVELIRVLQLGSSSVAILTLPGVWTEKRGSGAVNLGTAGISICMIAGLFRVFPEQLELALALSALFPTFLLLVLLVAGQQVAKKLENAMIASAMLTFAVWGFLLVGSAMFTAPASIAMIAVLMICCGANCVVTGNRAAMIAMMTLAVCLAAQLLLRFDLLNAYLITISIMLAGVSLILSRFVAEKFTDNGRKVTLRVQQVGNALVQLGVVGALIFTGIALLNEGTTLNHLGLLTVQMFGLGVAGAATREAHWRRIFSVTAMITCVAAASVVCAISTITIWQKLEIASLVLGLLMTVAGYFGWSRENGVRNDVVSFNLVVGSLLLAVPMILGLIADRFFVDSVIGIWRYLHEIGGLIIALLLLGSGILSQVRSTTLSGATLLATFVISNILLIDFPDQLQQTSVLMMIGGGVFFFTAITLSVYRERLMNLPEKIKEGQGVFQVLKWR